MPNTQIAICICWRSFKKCSRANIDSISHVRAVRPLLLQLLTSGVMTTQKKGGKCLRSLATLVSVPGVDLRAVFPLPYLSLHFNGRAVGVATLKQTALDVLRNLTSNKPEFGC